MVRKAVKKRCKLSNLAVVKTLLSGGANILAANNYGKNPIHFAVRQGHSAVSKYLLQMFYATISRLPLHELLKDLTWIDDDPNSSDAQPIFIALHRSVLVTDDAVEILEFLVSQNAELLSSRDQDT
jgi:hypothetical protein